MDQALQTGDQDIAAMLREVLARLERPRENELWDSEDIASYMRLSKKSVQNHILDKRGFPKAVVLVTGGKRWVASEVKAWVLRRR